MRCSWRRRVWAGTVRRQTGEKSYLEYMDRQWWITSNLLYNPQEHLYSRDASFLDKHEANGKKIFWSRGNGWVMAGLARVLEVMPEDYPNRAKYVEQFRQMASRVAELQGAGWVVASGIAQRGWLSASRGLRIGFLHLCHGVGHKPSHFGSRTSICRLLSADGLGPCPTSIAMDAGMHSANWRGSGGFQADIELCVWRRGILACGLGIASSG